MGTTNMNMPPPPIQQADGSFFAQQPQQPQQGGGWYGAMGSAIARLKQNQAMYQQQPQQFQPFQQQSLTFQNNEAPNPFFGKYFN